MLHGGHFTVAEFWRGTASIRFTGRWLVMTPKFTRGGYHRNGGTLLAPDLRRELGKVPGQVLRRNPHGRNRC
jgi:hypothetical protein